VRPALGPLAVLAVTVVASPTAAAAEGGGAVQETLVTALALLVVCALAYAALHLLKRFGGGSGVAAGGLGDELHFLRALPVGPRERLVLVRWRGRTLLLGVTAGGISVLDQDSAEASDGDLVAGLEPATLTRTLLARVFVRRPRDNPS
jgi:flagellar protein FliO/FliZ